MRLRVITNGKHAQDPRLAAAIARGRSWGLRIEECVPTRDTFNHEIERAVRDGLDKGFDVLVAAGGDGTLNRVVAGAMGVCGPQGCAGAGFSLGLIPLGTANDFASAAGIAHPIDAMRLIANAPAQAIDVGRMNGQPFVNMMSGGFGARITAEADPRLKKVMGGAAYVVTGLRRAAEVADQSARVTGEGPLGPMEWEGRFSVLSVGNGPTAGGGLAVCEDALVDDGLLDLTIIPAMDPSEAAQHLPRLASEGIKGLGPDVFRARVTSLRVEAPKPFDVNLDGEPLCCDRLDIDLAPGAVRLHLAPHSPVLANPAWR